MTDLDVALKELSAAQPDYLKAEQYFEGTQEEVFASPKLKKALERTGTQWRLNFARTVVNAVLNRIQLISVNSEDRRVQEFVEETWNFNGIDQESDDITLWFLVYGESYAMVWPGEDDTLDVTYNSPRTTRLFYDVETGRRKDFAAKVWTERSGKVRATLYYPDRIEKYISKTDKPKSGEDFVRFYDYFEPLGEVYDELSEDDDPSEMTAVWPMPNPFNEIPVFHFRTQRPRGRPEHKDAYSPQDMINKLVITQMASNDFQGFPQRWALAGNKSADDAETFDDDVYFDEEDYSEDGTTPKLNAGPGELWWLEGVESVGQFAVADADAFLEPLREYVKAMATTTETPLHYFQGFGGNEPSGQSKRESASALVKKVSDRKQVLGSVWKELWTFAARVGLELNESPDISLTWSPSETYDDKDAWETAKAKQDAGVPVARTLVERGYTQTEVEEWSNGNLETEDS